MMARQQVVLIGNSHLAALSAALGEASDLWPNLEFSAIGGRVQALLGLDLDPSVPAIVGRTEAARDALALFAGSGRLTLAPGAAIVIVGAQLALPRLLSLFRSGAWPDLPSVRCKPETGTLLRTLMSRAAFAATARSVMSTTAAVTLAARLAPKSSGPVFVASQPRTSAAALDRPRSGLGHLRTPIANGDAPALSDIFEEAALGAVLATGATYLPQPTNTTKAALLTDEAFVRGAVKLRPGQTVPQGEDDLIHANAAYGAEVLDQIAEALAA